MFRCVDHRGRGVDRRHLERKIRPTESGEIGGQHQQIGRLEKGRERPGEEQGEEVVLGRCSLWIVQFGHFVLEAEQSTWVHFEGQVQIDRPVAGFLRMEIDFPHLAEGVGLHEMAFIVDVETVVHGMALQVGHETGHIDECHDTSSSGWFDTTLRPVGPDDLLDLFHRTSDAVSATLAGVRDWGPSGLRPGQYAADLKADEAALSVLREAGVGILSEESPPTGLDADIVVVLDPLDGSTNASRGIPHCATSLCAFDAEGPVVAMVAHQARATRWWAVRGKGAWRDGTAITPSDCCDWSAAVVAISGPAPTDPGWAQYRAFGASAIDICLVADGTVDAFIDMSVDAHGVWDYAAGWLIGREAGIEVRDAHDRELLALDWQARRTPVAAPATLMARALEVRARVKG